MIMWYVVGKHSDAPSLAILDHNAPFVLLFVLTGAKTPLLADAMYGQYVLQHVQVLKYLQKQIVASQDRHGTSGCHPRAWTDVCISRSDVSIGVSL
jgi:hypothetical protein